MSFKYRKGENKMKNMKKTNKKLSEAVVLLITAVLITSMSAVVADTPENLNIYSVETNKVLVNSPIGEVELSYYDPDTVQNVIGLSGGTPPYYWASGIRLTQDELSPYVGWEMTKVIFALSTDNGQTEVYGDLQIYGEGTATQPGSLIYEETDLFFDATGFYTIDLSESIALDDHDEIWITVMWEQTEEGAYIPYMDEGPAVAGKGDWAYYNSQWSELAGAGLDYNWAMGGIVEGTNAELSIINVKGPIGVNAGIENIGEDTANNVEYTIDVTGGLLGLVNVSASGSIATIAVGAEEAISSGILIGFGSIDIVITASADNAVEKTATKSGFLLGILVIGI
jgi:hypothetical protein